MQIRPTDTAFMVQQFKLFAASIGASQRFNAYNMTNGVADNDTITDSISESVLLSIKSHLNATTYYLDHPDSKPDRCIKL